MLMQVIFSKEQILSGMDRFRDTLRRRRSMTAMTRDCC
jgi:hypothetical protein